MSEPAIRIDGLTKYYGAVVGIEELSLQVERGEVFGFLGANGAGKTTTIRLLLDLLRPSRGRAFVLGRDCHRESLQTRRLIGYLPGDLPVYPDLTAGAYLGFLSRLDDRPVPAEYLRALLRRFDVSDVDLARRLRQQSHGMKQKIGIIQALMARRPLVVLDEPTAGLDPFMAQAFREVVEEIRTQGDTTVFLSSHVLTEVEATCDRVGIIRGGRIVNVSALEDLRARAPRRVIIQFSAPVASSESLPPGALLRSATGTQWDLDVEGPLGPLLQQISALPMKDISVEPFSLERHVMQFYA
ncbi:MAG TPA: ABC transporter ATP-binding protein [Vicinamibacterales bacterium]|nr:ABC transporter ATP-binding protein [Vicinamibacterales bacterium]